MDTSLVAEWAIYTLVKKVTHSLTLSLRLENMGLCRLLLSCFRLHGEIDSLQSVFYTDR